VKILKVEIGAYYQGKIYDYWIHGQLSNGKRIKIFDHIPYDLRRYEGEEVSLLVQASIISEFNLNNHSIKEELGKKEYLKEFKGKYLGLSPLPKEWEKHVDSSSFHENLKGNWHFLKFGEEIFIISPREFNNEDIKKDEELYIRVGRYDLIAWRKNPSL